MMPRLDLKSIKLGYLIALKYLSRNWKPFAVSLAATLLLLLLQYQFKWLNFNPSLSEGLIGTYQEHDLPEEVTRLASVGLVESDATGRVHGKLASGWETNNDATLFTFKLKSGLLWSDGSPIKSTDIEVPIPDVEVSYPNDEQIQFKLKDSYSPFPTLLAKPVFKKGTLVGTGPYKITKVEKSRIFITKLTLKPIRPDLPVVYVRFYPNEKTAQVGFEEGEIQSLLGVVDPKPMLGNSLVKLRQKTDYSRIITILYNTKDALVGNRSVRQALSFAAPKIPDQAEANNPLSIWSWAYDPDAKKYLDNQSEAEDALERAKKNVSDEILHRELILTATPHLEGVGKQVVKAWRDLGFDAKLRIESGVPQNFHALLITQGIPLDPDQYSLWHSTQTKTNLTKYSFARVDKDLEDGRKLIGEDDRKSKYQDFQKALLEDTPATFLYYHKFNVVFLQKVGSTLDQVLPLQLSSEFK